MTLPGQKVDIVNLNHEPFPYAEATFDIITATEVVEHLERCRKCCGSCTGYSGRAVFAS